MLPSAVWPGVLVGPLRFGAVLDDGDRFSAALHAWLAEGRAGEAVDARRREHWLATQAREEAALLGVLIDLAERARAVRVGTRSGRRLVGRVLLVGTDVVVVRAATGPVVLVALGAVTSVRPGPDEPAVTGDRRSHAPVSLAEVLRLAVEDRPGVVVGLEGGEVVTGQLLSVGRDVAAVRGEDGTAHVVLGAVDEVTLAGDRGPLG